MPGPPLVRAPNACLGVSNSAWRKTSMGSGQVALWYWHQYFRLLLLHLPGGTLPPRSVTFLRTCVFHSWRWDIQVLISSVRLLFSFQVSNDSLKRYRLPFQYQNNVLFFPLFSVGAVLNVASIRCHLLEPFVENNYFNNTMVKIPKRLCHLYQHNCQLPHMALFQLTKILLVLVKTTAGGNFVSSMGSCPELEQPKYWVYDFKKCYTEDLEEYKKIRNSLYPYVWYF